MNILCLRNLETSDLTEKDMEETTNTLNNLTISDEDTDQAVVINVRHRSKKILGIMEERANLWSERRHWKSTERGVFLMNIFQKERYHNHAKVLFITEDTDLFGETELFSRLLKSKNLCTENITIFARCQLCSTIASDTDVQRDRRKDEYYPRLGRFLHTCRDCEGEHFPSVRRSEYVTHVFYKRVSSLPKLSCKLMVSAIRINIALPCKEELQITLQPVRFFFSEALLRLRMQNPQGGSQ